MKSFLCRSLPLFAGFSATAIMAMAHPGHDGGELTWDLQAGHLAAHPLATAAGALLLLVGTWTAARLVAVGMAQLDAAVQRVRSEKR